MRNPDGLPNYAPVASGQRGLSSNPTGSAYSAEPLTPNTMNSRTMQSPALNGIRLVPPALNHASQPQSNLPDLPPNFMSSDLIQSMSALSMSASEDLDPSPALNGIHPVPLASNPAGQTQSNLSDLPPNIMDSDFIQSMSALEDLDPSMFRTDFEEDFREWFDPTGVDATTGRIGPSSNRTGSAHGTAPPTPNTINSGITQSPALNGIRSPASNPVSQPQPNLPPNFMSSDFIHSMLALEDLDPSMFQTDFERDFREWFDPTGVDLK